jgi:hypothetical protein
MACHRVDENARTMTSTPATTTDARRIPGLVLGALSSDRRAGCKGLRAALLLIIWVLPGLWCAAHLLAHAFESEDPGSNLAISAGDRIAGMSQHHDHGHTHPEFSPVVFTGGTKELATPTLLAAAIELEPSTSTLQRQPDSVLGHTARHAVAASGPRAPPIA